MQNIKHLCIDDIRSDITDLLLLNEKYDFMNYTIKKTNNQSLIKFDPDEFNNYLKLPEIEIFVRLLNNYHSDLSESESYDDNKKKEIQNFLDVLKNKRYFKNISEKYSITIDELIEITRHIFFDLYCSYNPKSKKLNTCAFEHIFVGENSKKTRKESGFHCWIQLFRKILNKEITNFDIQQNDKIINDEYYNNSYGNDKTKSNKSIIQCSMKINSNEKKSDNIIIGIDPYIETCIYLLSYLYTKSINLDNYRLELSDLFCNIDLMLSIYYDHFRTCFVVFNIRHLNNITAQENYSY